MFLTFIHPSASHPHVVDFALNVAYTTSPRDETTEISIVFFVCSAILWRLHNKLLNDDWDSHKVISISNFLYNFRDSPISWKILPIHLWTHFPNQLFHRYWAEENWHCYVFHTDHRISIFSCLSSPSIFNHNNQYKKQHIVYYC